MLAKKCIHGIKPIGKCRICHNERVRLWHRNNYDPSINKAKYDKDKDAQIVRGNNQRAKRLGIPGVITLEYWLSIKQSCYYCKQSDYLLHMDHTIPLSAGGTNEPENVKAVCEFCNMAKRNKTEAEFIKWLSGVNRPD